MASDGARTARTPRLLQSRRQGHQNGERRKARSARRQLEHQEQKRAGFIAQLVANGCELAHAQAAVADGERARLARLAQRGAVPMDAEAAPAARAP